MLAALSWSWVYGSSSKIGPHSDTQRCLLVLIRLTIDLSNTHWLSHLRPLGDQSHWASFCCYEVPRFDYFWIALYFARSILAWQHLPIFSSGVLLMRQLGHSYYLNHCLLRFWFTRKIVLKQMGCRSVWQLFHFPMCYYCQVYRMRRRRGNSLRSPERSLAHYQPTNVLPAPTRASLSAFLPFSRTFQTTLYSSEERNYPRHAAYLHWSC